MKDALKDTLYFFNRNKGAMMALLGPYLLLLVIISITLQLFAEASPWLIGLEVAVLFAIQPLYIGRLIKFMHTRVNQLDEPLTLSLQEWWRLLVVYAVYGLAVTFGMVLLIIPGIVLSVRLGFSEFEAVLNKQSPMVCVGNSWKASKPYFWQMLGGALLFGGCSLLLTMLIPVAPEADLIGKILESSASTLVSTLLTVLMTVFFFRVYDGMLSARNHDIERG